MHRDEVHSASFAALGSAWPIVIAVAVGTPAISIAGGALLALHRDASPLTGRWRRRGTNCASVRFAMQPRLQQNSLSANAFSKDVPASIAARAGRRAPAHTEVVEER
jgi:hypothetical protein